MDMTDAKMPARPVRTWIVGGALLITFGALTAVSTLVRASDELQDERTAQVIDLVAAIVLLLACGCCAFGLRREESIVARRSVGVAVLVAIGVLDVAYSLWWMTPLGYGAGPGAAVQGLFWVLAIWALILVAVVSISRARVLPRPWNAAPLAAVGIAVVLLIVSGLLLPAMNVIPDPRGVLALAPSLLLIALGVISLVLGLRHGASSDAASPVETTGAPRAEPVQGL